MLLPQKSFASTAVNWSAPELDGVNFQIACVEGLSVFQVGSSLPLPCGQIVFPLKHSSSGNLIFKFKNTITEMLSEYDLVAVHCRRCL